MLTGWLLVGSFGRVVCLLGVASILLRTGRVVGMQARAAAGASPLQGFARPGENRVQILVFGLAIMLLLIIYLTRTALLDEWQNQMPPDAPNHFVFNIAPFEVDELRGLLQSEGEGAQPFFPMMRGRVVALNGEALDTARAAALAHSRAKPRAPRRCRRRAIVEGTWWSEQSDMAEVSDR